MRLRVRVISVVALALLLGAPAVRGAEEPLSQMALAAKDHFRPLSKPHAAALRTYAQRQLNQLHAWLAQRGPAATAAWDGYLHWDELQQQVQAETPNPAVVESILDAWEQNQVGLETPRFLRARNALRLYSHYAAAAADPNYRETYNKRLDDLAERLDAIASSRATDDAAAIGRTLGWLENTYQADELVKTIRNRYRYSNLYGSMSEQLAAIGFYERVDRVAPVSDDILGTSIQGTARLVGTNSMQLVPSNQQAQFMIQLNGQINSNTVGQNRGVTIYTTGVTSVHATKILSMNEAGLTGGCPTAHCETCTSINGICAKRAFVERIAWKKAYKSKGEAEAIASEHAEARVSQQYEEASLPLIVDTNRRFNQQFKAPLIRRGAYPEQIQFSSSADRVFLRSLIRNAGQLGLQYGPPRLPATYDLVGQVHELAVINAAEDVLAGVTLTDERLVRLLRDELKAEVPEELQITEDKDPWSITFASETPVRAKFDDQTVRLAIRGDRFTRAEQVINQPIEISATYKVERTADGMARLVRDGDVSVDFLGQERLSATQIGFRTFMRAKFRALFKEEFVGKGLTLKGRWANAGTLKLQQLDADNQWISLGWNLPQAAPKQPGAAGPG